MQRNCKSCGQYIPKSVKICPYCGAKNKKPIYKQPWFIVCIIVVSYLYWSNNIYESSTEQNTATPDYKAENLYEVNTWDAYVNIDGEKISLDKNEIIYIDSIKGRTGKLNYNGQNASIRMKFVDKLTRNITLEEYFENEIIQLCKYNKLGCDGASYILEYINIPIWTVKDTSGYKSVTPGWFWSGKVDKVEKFQELHTIASVLNNEGNAVSYLIDGPTGKQFIMNEDITLDENDIQNIIKQEQKKEQQEELERKQKEEELNKKIEQLRFSTSNDGKIYTTADRIIEAYKNEETRFLLEEINNKEIVIVGKVYEEHLGEYVDMFGIQYTTSPYIKITAIEHDTTYSIPCGTSIMHLNKFMMLKLEEGMIVRLYGTFEYDGRAEVNKLSYAELLDENNNVVTYWDANLEFAELPY